jgi:hypothetical protein
MPILDERVDAREQNGEQRGRDRSPQRERK